MRIGYQDFQDLLLRNQGLIVGRLDARYKSRPSACPDPSYLAAFKPIAAGVDYYLVRDLRFKTKLLYRPNRALFGVWNPKSHASADGQQALADTSVDLLATMRRNPALKLLVLSGVYDLGTPFFGAEYDLREIAQDSKTAANMSIKYYEAGHMMYVDPPSAERMHQDLVQFYKGAL